MVDWEGWRISAEQRHLQSIKDKRIEDWQKNWGKYFLKIPSLPGGCGALLSSTNTTSDYALPNDEGTVLYFELNNGFPKVRYDVHLPTPYNLRKMQRTITEYERIGKVAYHHPDFGVEGDYEEVVIDVWESNSLFRKRKRGEYLKQVRSITPWGPGSEPPNFGIVVDEKIFKRDESFNGSGQLWVEDSRLIVRKNFRSDLYLSDDLGDIRRVVRSKFDNFEAGKSTLHPEFGGYVFTDEVISPAEKIIK